MNMSLVQAKKADLVLVNVTVCIFKLTLLNFLLLLNMSVKFCQSCVNLLGQVKELTMLL